MIISWVTDNIVQKSVTLGLLLWKYDFLQKKNICFKLTTTLTYVAYVAYVEYFAYFAYSAYSAHSAQSADSAYSAYFHVKEN